MSQINYFWRINILVYCCAANNYSKVLDFFSKILNQSERYETNIKINETKIAAENVFNPDHIWMKDKDESKHEKQILLLGIFADSWAVP